MHTVGLVFSFGLLAIVSYIAWSFYSDYRTEQGTRWQRLIASASHSATILWAKFCLVIAAATAQLDSVMDLIGAPEAKDAINTYIGNPKIIAGVMLAIAGFTIFARKRTL